MTKKDYEKIAQAIKIAKDRALGYYGGDPDDANDMLMGINYVLEEMAKMLKKDNSKFKADKFYDSCIFEEEKIK